MDPTGWQIAGLACGAFALVTMVAMGQAVARAHPPMRFLSMLPDRYVALGLLTAFVTWYGDLTVLAALFAVGTLIGLAEGWIYWRRVMPHSKHTDSGIMSFVAFLATPAARIQAGGI